MFKSLYSKFTFITIMIMIVSSILAFMFSNFYYQQELKPKNDAKNTVIATDIVAYIESSEQMDLHNYLESLANVGYQFYLHDGDSGVFFGEDFRDKSLAHRTIESVMTGEVYHGMLNLPQETFVTGFFANELKNTIGLPVEYEGQTYALFMRPDIKMLFSEMHILFAWLLAAVVLLSIVFVLISTKYMIRPITHLTEAAEKLAEGDFSIELDLTRNDEIGQLSQRFTYMATELKKLDDLKSEFIGNITHDIQSPLSNIKGYIGLLENESLSETEKKQYIDITIKEINRLSSLTKQLLTLASLEKTTDLVQISTFSLTTQLKNIIRYHQWQMDEHGIMLSFNLPEIEVAGDKALLENLFTNLITNAIKYNVEDGEIKISATQNDETTQIIVSDTGIGMDASTKTRIFERFYREDTSRTRKIEGTGLGLSIAGLIVNLHEGTLEVESEKGKGTTFTVTLPRD